MADNTTFKEAVKDFSANGEPFAGQKEFCRKYCMLLQALYEDEALRKWCNNYSAYDAETEHKGLEQILYSSFMKEAYSAGLVIHNYSEIIEKDKLAAELVAAPTDTFIAQLSELQILACIAWHFRADHFSEGSLIAESIGDGILLKYFKALIGR